MAYGVLIPESIMATNVDSLNRNVKDALAVEQGSVFVMGAKSATSGEEEVWEISVPVTASLTDLWMAYSGDEVVLTASKYKGLDPDPRNFINAAGDVFSAYKPQVGDLILVTADALAGTKSTNTFVVATDSAWKLTWAASAISGLSYSLIGEKYISIGNGGISDSQRVTAYELECVAIA